MFSRNLLRIQQKSLSQAAFLIEWTRKNMTYDSIDCLEWKCSSKMSQFSRGPKCKYRYMKQQKQQQQNRSKRCLLPILPPFLVQDSLRSTLGLAVGLPLFLCSLPEGFFFPRWLGFSITAREKQLTQYLIIYNIISIQMLNEIQQFQLLYPAVLCSRTQLKCYIICSSYETSPSSKHEVAPQSWHLTGSKLTALCLPMLSEAFSLLGHYGNRLAPLFVLTPGRG